MRLLSGRVSAVLAASFAGLAIFGGSTAFADLTVPAYSSNPGAAYTLYVDFGGFTFQGDWGASSPTATGGPNSTPGTTPAYHLDSTSTTFTTADLTNIQTMWSQVATKFAGSNVNVTTVDPAPAGYTDAQRQAYYDASTDLTHTIIGGDGAWTNVGGPIGGSGSNIGHISSSYGNPSTFNGGHTNFDFAGQAADDTLFYANTAAHEDGHSFGLFHQSVYVVGTGNVNEYDPGDPAGPTNGNSSVSPLMGGYQGTRVNWRVGTTDTGLIQNDYAVILANPGMNLTDDGVGHTLAAAAALPLTGSTVNAALAKGVIDPASQANPQPLGIANYTTDFFKFATNGTNINLVLNAGDDLVTPGVADPGATFDGSFDIFNASNGSLVGTSTRDASTLFYSYDGTLAAGTYDVQVIDFGGYTSPTEADTGYYTSGAYFFTGSGGFVSAVPEPTSIAFLAIGSVGFLARRRRVAK